MHFEVMEGPFAGVEWRLASVVGEEALSDLFSFHLLVGSPSPVVTEAMRADIEDALVGRSVGLRMSDADITRYGIVSHVEMDPRDELTPGMIRVVMRPRAWLLTLRKNTRIFQGKYMHEIVSQILTESGVPHRFALGNSYPKRVYCTQYEETDYAFVSRLLAEEGVYYYFEHVDGFAPDPPPAAPDKSKLATAAAIVGVVGTVATAVAGQTESNAKASGILGTVGSAASIFSDAATGPGADPEADDPIPGASGRAGPTPPGATEVFVFGDQWLAYRGCSATDPDVIPLRYGQPGTSGAFDAVTSLTSARTAGTRAVEIRDYNFRRPMALLSKTDKSPEAPALTAPLDHYEHHGEYEKPDIDDEQVQIRLEQLRAATSVMKGESTCARLQPGFASEITEVPQPFTDGRYVPVKVIHEAYNPSHASSEKLRLSGDEAIAEGAERVAEAVGTLLRNVEGSKRRLGEGELREMSRLALSRATPAVRMYQNRFEWVAADVVFRPPLPERIRHAVNETAVVVGPAGQSIYVDNYGRVKVQFHWDREGKYNENSSCWIRVLSTWAGAGYGFQFFPRVGMEVVVTFLGGDPDRPVVSGSLYNATHPTPEPLPQRLTRSGFRSQTVPGGAGFNELSFEDGQGVERVFLHAQKDLHEVVNDLHTSTVRGDEKMTVGGDQHLGVTGTRVVAAGGSSAEIVGQNRAERVGGNLIEQVGQNRAELVRGNALSEVRGVSIAETVSHDLKVVQGDCNLTVHGHHVIQVVSKKEGPKATTTTYVDGHSFHTATGKVVIRAENADKTTDGSSLRLECGDSFIELQGDTITFSAKNVAIRASESFTVDGKKAEVRGSDHVRLTRDTGQLEMTGDGFAVKGVDKLSLGTSQSKLSLDGGSAELASASQATIKSGAVKLASGGAGGSSDKQSDSATQQADTQRLSVAFCHPHKSDDAEAIASARYRLTTDGFVHEGTTGGDGSIDVQVPRGTKEVTVVLFANELDDYKVRYPSPLVWQLQIEDDLHAARDVQGARVRLRNLGYSPGTDLTITSLEKDPVTAAAISEFQRDQRIRVSGKLDEDDTSTKLDKAYGEAQ